MVDIEKILDELLNVEKRYPNDMQLGAKVRELLRQARERLNK